MRLDPEHTQKLAQAITTNENGTPEVKLDIEFMRRAMDRLTLWERGLFMHAIMRALAAKRKTIEQRVILAMFVHQDDSP